MKEATKQARENEKIALLLGITPEAVQSMRDTEDADYKAREAQAVLLFIEKPDAFISKKCDWCHGQFLTTYQFVSVCSTNCRIKSLEKIGITWNPLHTPEERWKRSQIPTEYSIPPKALEVLLALSAEQQQNTPQAETYQVEAAVYPLPDELISEPLELTANNPPLSNGAPEFLEPELPSVDDLLSEDYFSV